MSTFENLLARLQENANAAVKPIAVEIPGIGKVYVRKRTVLEFEEMAEFRKSLQEDSEEGGAKLGLFAPSLARLLCDEAGNRFTADEEKQLAAILVRQPEDVFHAILAASDGTNTKEVKEGK